MFNTKKYVKSQKGQTLVETALVLLIIIMLMLGIADFGLFFSKYFVLSNASREGARYAALGMQEIDVETEIVKLFQDSMIDSSDVTISITKHIDEEKPNKSNVEVKLTCEHNPIAPGLSKLGLNEIIAVTFMRLE